MLTFEKIRYKNFLAVGDAPIELELNKHQRSLIIGENGSGKSSIIEALTFALFNCSYRGMNKPQLINSINNRDCVVELWFTQGTDKFYIRRGMKPNFFEITKNGQLLNQDAAARDQQAWFEKTVIRMDFNSFAQIVVLGSALYTPFMMLNAYDRRVIVENILGIEIFGRMFKILKNSVSTWKENYAVLQGEIKTSETEIKLVSDFLNKLKESLESQKESRLAQIEEIKTKIASHNEKIRELETGEMNTRMEMGELSTELLQQSLQTSIKKKAATDSGMNAAKKEIRFFETSTTCRVCSQPIDEAHKKQHLDQLNEQVKSAAVESQKLAAEIEEITKEIERIGKLKDKMRSYQDAIKTNKVSISTLASQGAKLAAETKDQIKNESQIEYEERQKKAQAELVRLRRKHENMVFEKAMQEYATAILKDSGIKAQIIKYYIPIINHLVNGYLRTLNFFVKFEMDENFNEIIKSRGRDEFTYHSFSMGERTRIDLALLFTWREIARMRNSLSTNLIIFDEIGDSSLDQEGFDCFFQIINKIDKANVFVISHREIFTDKFNNLIRLEKVKNFSRVVE